MPELKCKDIYKKMLDKLLKRRDTSPFLLRELYYPYPSVIGKIFYKDVQLGKIKNVEYIGKNDDVNAYIKIIKN